MPGVPEWRILNTDRVKHLEFIQAVVSRLAGNSFLIKGWAVTLVAALFALAAKESQHWFAVISLLPTACFWGLDGYFLRQERLFRRLFRHSASPDSTVPMYSMDPSPYAKEVESWIGTCRSPTIVPFYLPIVVAALLATALTWPSTRHVEREPAAPQQKVVTPPLLKAIPPQSKEAKNANN